MPAKRKPPSPPFSALDLPMMLKTFEENDYPVKEYHILEFQRKLHKAGYPALTDFDWHDFPKVRRWVLGSSRKLKKYSRGWYMVIKSTHPKNVLTPTRSIYLRL